MIENNFVEVIEGILKDNKKPTEGIKLVENKGDFTLWLYSEALLKFKVGKANYIYVKKEFQSELAELVRIEKVNAPAGWIRFQINQLEELRRIEHVIIKIFDSVTVSDEFACCHLYQECSAVGKCISVRIERARACIYRKNLENGLNFYH